MSLNSQVRLAWGGMITLKNLAAPFWERKELSEMTNEEWELLCDGCGKCCLNKLEDPDTGEIRHTNIACRLLNPVTCRCSSYNDRKKFVPDCRKLSPKNLNRFPWLPSTCAYKLIARGQKLFWWHPLISKNPETIHEAGVSVRGRVVSERDTDDFENHFIDWLI